MPVAADLLGALLALGMLAPQQQAPDSARAARDTAVTLRPVTVRAQAAPPRWAPLGSATLGARELAAAGGDAHQIMRLARAMSGATLSGDRLYVDGLPAAALPDPADIARLSVNADPFSAAYSESDDNVIAVTTSDPDARGSASVRFGPGGAGSRNPLAPELRSRHASALASASMGIPGTPAVSALRLARTSVSSAQPVFDPLTGESSGPAALLRGASGSGTFLLAAPWPEGARSRVAFTAHTGWETGAGAGGVVSADAATRTTTSSRDVSAFTMLPIGWVTFRGSLLVRSVAHRSRADARAAAVHIVGDHAGGAAGYAAMDASGSEVRVSGALAAPRWTAGWSLARLGDAAAVLPNAHGQLLFGGAADYQRWLDEGDAGGLARFTRGASHVTRDVTMASLYGQREWQHGAAAFRAGARGDYDSSDGMRFSPRLSASWQRGILRLTSGAGIFRQSVPNEIWLAALRDACAGGPSCSQTTVEGGGAVHSLRSGIAQGFSRPGALVLRQGAELSWGAVVAGAEHAFTRGFNRLGSRREPASDGWVDVLESNRGLRRHQLHARLGIRARGTSVVAHVERFSARDNSAGPFTFAPSQGDAAEHWAPSANTPLYHAAAVLTPPPIGGTAAVVIYAARSRPRLDLLAGLDADGSFLFAQRVGGERNTGWGAPYRSLDVMLWRRVTLPYPRGERRLAFDVTVGGDNLLNAVNVTALGVNAASASYGRAVAAQPGRTLRIGIGAAAH